MALWLYKINLLVNNNLHYEQLLSIVRGADCCFSFFALHYVWKITTSSNALFKHSAPPPPRDTKMTPKKRHHPCREPLEYIVSVYTL